MDNTVNKPITVRELVDKLNLVMDKGWVNENDMVFFGKLGEDEGSLDSLFPVANITGNSIFLLKSDTEKLAEMKAMEGIELSFIVDGVRNV